MIFFHGFPFWKKMGGIKTWLVGGFNPFEKYARQIGSSPQVGMKINIFETTTYS